jgi:hypothetical protein
MAKHSKAEASGLKLPTRRAKAKRATKRKRAAPLDAGFTRGVPKGQIPSDLRSFTVDDCHAVWARLEARLVKGCGVVLLSTNKKIKPRIGRYWPGPPERFAEYVDPFLVSRTSSARGNETGSHRHTAAVKRP